MQVKKEEIKNAILKAGQTEFYNKGYNKASIRTIVKNAHTTIGNFYNYFNSKEDLYHNLVSDIYHHLMSLISHHNDYEFMPQFKDMTDLTHQDIQILMQSLSDIFPIIDLRFSLLMDDDHDSPLNNARHDFQELLEKHFLEHALYHQQVSDSELVHLKMMASIVAHQFIEGLIKIGSYNLSKAQASQLVTELIIFYGKGMS